MPAASVATHLAAMKLQMGRFEHRGTRAWSRVKNGIWNMVTTGLGYGVGSLAKWALCALAFSTPAVVIGGLAAGFAASMGAFWASKKYGLKDDPKTREKAGAQAAVLRQMESDPVFRARMQTPALLDAEVERRTKTRMRINTAVMFAANLGVSGAFVHHQTGGKIWSTPFESYATWGEKVDKTLALFACATPAPSGSAAANIPQPTGRGSAAAAAIQNQPAPKARAASTGFNGLTNAGAPNGGGRGIQWDYGSAPHPANLPDGHPAKHFKSKTFFVDFGNPGSRAAPLKTHIDCCYQGLGNIAARWDANSPTIQRLGSGYWNSSTSGSLQQTLGFPRRW
jgi:hypothetical protein